MAEASRSKIVVAAKENHRRRGDKEGRREANRRVTVMKATEYDANLASNIIESQIKSKPS